MIYSPIGNKEESHPDLIRWSRHYKKREVRNGLVLDPLTDTWPYYLIPVLSFLFPNFLTLFLSCNPSNSPYFVHKILVTFCRPYVSSFSTSWYCPLCVLGPKQHWVTYLNSLCQPLLHQLSHQAQVTNEAWSLQNTCVYILNTDAYRYFSRCVRCFRTYKELLQKLMYCNTPSTPMSNISIMLLNINNMFWNFYSCVWFKYFCTHTNGLYASCEFDIHLISAKIFRVWVSIACWTCPITKSA